MRNEIESLYRVFSGYPAPEGVEGCRHCVTEQDHRDLLGAPLRELDAERLSRFSRKALHTWGGVDDLRHFLPRLLELALGGQGDLRGLFSQLRRAGWRSWPVPERDAVRACLIARWENSLAGQDRPSGRALPCELLEAVVVSGDDPAPYLDSWWGRGSPQALWALAALVDEVARTAPRARDDRVVTWLSTTRAWIESAFFETAEAGHTELAEALSEADRFLGLIVPAAPGPGGQAPS